MTAIQSLPPLPRSLKGLGCSYTPLTSLPPLPDSLLILNCYNTKIKELPRLPKTLVRLCCQDTAIERLPDLPEGLLILDCDTQKIRWRLEQDSKQRIQRRMKSVEEELVAATWHPDRFETWCLDEEEKKETEEMCD